MRRFLENKFAALSIVLALLVGGLAVADSVVPSRLKLQALGVGQTPPAQASVYGALFTKPIGVDGAGSYFAESVRIADIADDTPSTLTFSAYNSGEDRNYFAQFCIFADSTDPCYTAETTPNPGDVIIDLYDGDGGFTNDRVLYLGGESGLRGVCLDDGTNCPTSATIRTLAGGYHTDSCAVQNTALGAHSCSNVAVGVADVSFTVAYTTIFSCTAVPVTSDEATAQLVSMDVNGFRVRIQDFSGTNIAEPFNFHCIGT